tara:strand:- start:6673 stop:6861 length:189 start_codon:yes stop_codon:yes gene_type:complete
VVKYDPAELILSVIYYSGGAYQPDEILEIMEIIELYQKEDGAEKKSAAELRIVPINTGEIYD